MYRNTPNKILPLDICICCKSQLLCKFRIIDKIKVWQVDAASLLWENKIWNNRFDTFFRENYMFSHPASSSRIKGKNPVQDHSLWRDHSQEHWACMYEQQRRLTFNMCVSPCSLFCLLIFSQCTMAFWSKIVYIICAIFT